MHRKRWIGSIGLAWGLALVAAFARPAAAEVMSVPPTEPGGIALVRDTETGLDWLPFGYTAGSSLAGILSGGGGWIADGWRYATQDEVCDLFEHAAQAPPGTGCGVEMSADNANTMLGLFGTLDVQVLGSVTAFISEAFYDDGNPGDMQGGVIFVVETPVFLVGPVVAAAPDSLYIFSTTGNYSAPVASMLVRTTQQPVPMLGWVGWLALIAGLAITARVAEGDPSTITIGNVIRRKGVYHREAR